MLIYWNKRKHLHEKRVKLPEDFLGTPTWLPFHCLEHQYGRRDVMWKRSIACIMPWLSFVDACDDIKETNLKIKKVKENSVLFHPSKLLAVQEIAASGNGIGWFLDLKVTQQSDFYFTLSLLTSFSLFLPVFFSLAGHLLGFILVGKAFRILGLDEMKSRWVVEQDFHGHFQVNVTMMVFCLFLQRPWLKSTHSGMVWKISSLCTSLQTKLSLTVKTDDVTSGRKDVDPHGRLGRMG